MNRDPQTLPRALILLLILGMQSACSTAETLSYDVVYSVALEPAADRARVVIDIPSARLIQEISFTADAASYSEITANGELRNAADRFTWVPPPEGAKLSLTAKISNQREDGEFDALMTADWAIFRGDDLIPPVATTTTPGATANASLELVLPDGWTAAVTGWSSAKTTTGENVRRFDIDNPERYFDRPTGWIIAGKLGVRRNQVGGSEIIIAAPRGDSQARMDRLVFLTLLWPYLEQALGRVPPKLLVVGADDPMWRGGLSAPNSLYLHSDRPLVSENGTSSLIHELIHVATRLRGRDNHDWIVEGIAEYYSFELLHRAGAMTDARRTRILETLATWSKEVTTLVAPQSKGKRTARAATLFAELDLEIRRQTANSSNIDDLVRILMERRKVSLTDLRNSYEQVTGKRSKVLQTSLLLP